MHYYKGTCSVLVGGKETISICGLTLQRGLLPPGGSNEVEMDVYQEQFGTRFVVECQEFQLRLQVNLAEDRKPQQLNNVSGALLAHK